ncbi:glutathione S-transferase N-terminal domain-containing protein [Enterovibrio sp. ZSDZ35]|uniref:Glutathione S-transferase N-terminal domain-containing protein n=1 Tax=Enterovibrio qingdaonensis TaxID=2899818 RepID=A0ABT5QQZ6_9GAMM|nr:glutathione S-transferase N-terminal domain-containing protein [Enterovibrio sp. ZSDZ35]MDD1783123.1 glutathione S-transferase N-terminal domain-containing protein [Enterovibrio sp. ZSDZ35]
MPELKAHSLYQRTFCPYCMKVRAALKMMSLDVALVDVSADPSAYQELVSEGGRGMVPCLRITHDDGTVEWMYESDDIIEYFQENFAG